MMGEIQKDEGGESVSSRGLTVVLLKVLQNPFNLCSFSVSEFHHEGDPAEASDSQQGAPQTLPGQTQE